MNNEKYMKELELRIVELKNLRKELIIISKEIIGDTLYKEDLFFMTAIDRSFALLDGTLIMLQKRNLTCSGILLRSQIDNCLRIFAAFIAEDRNSFIDSFLDGKKISSMKDNEGKKMRDYNLRKKLSEYDKLINIVYENTSGYVHLSNKSFYASVKASKSDTYDFEFSTGMPLKEDANHILIEIADAFLHYILLQNDLLKKVAISKKSISK